MRKMASDGCMCGVKLVCIHTNHCHHGTQLCDCSSVGSTEDVIVTKEESVSFVLCCPHLPSSPSSLFYCGSFILICFGPNGSKFRL